MVQSTFTKRCIIKEVALKVAVCIITIHASDGEDPMGSIPVYLPTENVEISHGLSRILTK
jgi:hypothetical protein